MSTFRTRKLSAATLLTLSLGACSLAPAYHQPTAPIPETWTQDTAHSKGAVMPLEIADMVTDEVLRDMVGAAIDRNRDLRQALLNVEAAYAEYGIKRSDSLPTVAMQGTGTRQRTPAGLSQTGTAATASVYQAGFGVTAFELDLFGRVRNLSESALQEYLAIEQNAQTVRISLAAEVMQTYILRKSSLARLEVTQRTLKAREASLELTHQRRQVGAASAIDLEDARGLTEQARADLEQIRRELQQTNNAMRLLLGSSSLDIELPGSQAPIFAVRPLGAGAPSELIRTRPDIIASENALKARHADIGAARAAFFPRLSLTAFLGVSSPELSSLFRGHQRTWSFTPELNVPIFNAGRNQANLDLANVRRDIAVARYEQTIQMAFREVADALVANDTLREEIRHRQALFESSQRTLALAQARYRGGLDSSLKYLDAQRTAYANEIGLIDVATQGQIAIVSLFKALGGRWYVTADRTPADKEPRSGDLL